MVERFVSIEEAAGSMPAFSIFEAPVIAQVRKQIVSSSESFRMGFSAINWLHAVIYCENSNSINLEKNN